MQRVNNVPVCQQKNLTSNFPLKGEIVGTCKTSRFIYHCWFQSSTKEMLHKVSYVNIFALRPPLYVCLRNRIKLVSGNIRLYIQRTKSSKNCFYGRFTAKFFSTYLETTTNDKILSAKNFKIE